MKRVFLFMVLLCFTSCFLWGCFDIIGEQEKECLGDIKLALQNRWNITEAESDSFEEYQENVRNGIQEELNVLQKYNSIQFENDAFDDIIDEYIVAIQNQQEGIEYIFTNADKYEELYVENGFLVRSKCVNVLKDKYGLTVDSEYEESFADLVNGAYSDLLAPDEKVVVNTGYGEISIILHKYEILTNPADKKEIVLYCEIENISYYDEWNGESLIFEYFLSIYDGAGYNIEIKNECYDYIDGYEECAGIADLKQGEKGKFAIILDYTQNNSIIYVSIDGVETSHGCYMLLSHTHDFSKMNPSDLFLKEEATCSNKALFYYSCECGARGDEVFEYGDILTHSYTEQIVDKKYQKAQATCLEPASYYFSCICGASGTKTFTDGDVRSHSYNKKIAEDKYLCSNATYDSAALYYYSCVCGKKGTNTFEYGESLSIWEQNFYVDYQFGEKTDEWYIGNKDYIEGTFENTATNKSPLFVEVLYDCNNKITIFLYEYADDDNLVKNNSSHYSDFYKIVVKNEKGTTYEARGQMYPGGDRIYIIDKYTASVLDIMKNSETLKFYIECEDSPTTRYRFDLAMSNFENLLSKLKVNIQDQSGYEEFFEETDEVIPQFIAPSIYSSEYAISLDVDESKTIYITVDSGSLYEYSVNATIDDGSIADCYWGEWDYDTIPLTIVGLEYGETGLTVSVENYEETTSLYIGIVVYD